MRVPPAPPATPAAHPVPGGDDEVPVEALGDLYRDGITACRGAFDPAWAEQVGNDVAVAFEEARSRADGAVGRGPQRWYLEIHPEQLRGFVELVSHPWVVSVCRAVLGPECEIVELGFDIPFPGAAMQPWHRDFPMPEDTRRQRRLTSLAFNLTTVDTVEEMGPFEIAPGTQWDDGVDFDHEMFPPRERYPRYQQRAVRKYPRRGDISARSALTIHRGTPNVSRSARPVLVLGVDAPGAGNAAHHDIAITHGYWKRLPALVREHLPCPVVDRLEPIRQKHTIEGLVMGAAE
ncbi:phytanoyl-CoA dioxygenase family protein [Micromonospora sp. NPDC005206]|uniref:phytanoyl-CoA dioxygenase family protein n=1 Tax=Micromonospora sp. NPDC005206 TaxID=3157022 RepID=UPI0033AB9A9B